MDSMTSTEQSHHVAGTWVDPLTVMKLGSRPDFLGELDQSRLIGHFDDEATSGDRLGFKNFIAQEFLLEQLEVAGTVSELETIIDRRERLRTPVDLFCIDRAVLQQAGADLVESLTNLLSPKALICIESSEIDVLEDARVLPDTVFVPVLIVPGLAIFAQIRGERSPRSICYQIDLYRRKRYVERRRLERLAAAPKIPEVAVFILTYKHEAFIAECLRSVMKQRGQFTMRVLIIDDCSPDRTAEVARAVIAENRDERITFELRVNPHNVGASANWAPALSWAKGADYMSPCDGDDFWNSENRIQKHIDFLRQHPLTLMSFNAFEFCTVDSSKRRRGIHFDHEILSVGRLIRDNPVGNLGSTFYCGELVDIFPLEPFYYVNGDWMINVYCSQISPMGYLDKALSVYRLHGGGVWSLRKGVDRILPTIESISKYNAFTDFNFNSDYNWLINDRYKALSPFVFNLVDDFGKVEIIILHDLFPSKNDFRYQEFTSILREFPSSLLLSRIDGNYQRQHPEFGSRVMEDQGQFPLHLGKLVYITAIGIAFANMQRIEEAGVPFVMSLSFEGGFTFRDADTDRQLKRIMSSPCFQKTIVTHQAICDYLVHQGLCAREGIDVCNDGLMSSNFLQSPNVKQRWQYGKTSLDLCIIGRHVTAYDGVGDDRVIAQLIRTLGEGHDDIHIHIYGSLDLGTEDLGFLGDRVKIYGPISAEKYDIFFKSVDIVLLCNLAGMVYPGSIDSFAAKICIEAGARGATILAAHEFSGVKGNFIHDPNIVAVRPNAAAIASEIERYYADPLALMTRGQMTAISIRATYHAQQHLMSRTGVLRAVLRLPPPARETLVLMARIAELQAQVEGMDEQFAKRSKKMRNLSLLWRGVRRFVRGRSNMTRSQAYRIFRTTGLKGLRRAFREMGV